MTLEDLGRMIRRSLKRSKAIQVEGLGVFARDQAGEISFECSKRSRIFIAYATEDREAAERLFDELTARGLSAWMDRRKLLPGQSWPNRIEDAIASSDFFIACFSSRSIKKRGGFQTDLRHALICANSVPLDDVFLIPVRLDDCRLPARIQREMQYVDLFPDWVRGFDSVLQIIEHQTRLVV